MGAATVIVFLLPTAAQIGVIAPIALLVLRIMQASPPVASGPVPPFPLLGGTMAFTLANATFLLTGIGMSSETFNSWGWCIPFVGSIVLIAVGLWVRLKIDETPVFKGEIARTGGSRFPFIEAIKRQPREILLAGGIGLTTFSFFFVTGYRYTASGISYNLGTVMGGAAAQFWHPY